MLVAFTVGNFRSFYEPVTLNLTAARISSRSPELDTNATFTVNPDLALLTSAGIYGANASGKSNLVRALMFMRSLVRDSSKESQSDEPIDTVPFRLSVGAADQPSYFEVVFLIDSITYRYGFEVTQSEIVSEWLFYAPFKKETYLFIREGNEIQVGRAFKGASGLKSRTRVNALFLSVAAQFNAPIAIKVMEWFRRLGVISGLSDTGYRGYSVKAFAEGRLTEKISDLIKNLDIGIKDIQVNKIDREELVLPKDMPEELKNLVLKGLPDEVFHLTTTHATFNQDGSQGGDEVFDMDEESEGTQKLFSLAGPILDTLTNGKILVVDEMEARLHTLITRALVGLFNNGQTNPQNAQLIFATHDTNLLAKDLFRRDQIWFVEKDRRGASQLYSLVELKVRNDASFEKEYLQGRYGAIPMLGSLRELTLEAGEVEPEICQ